MAARRHRDRVCLHRWRTFQRHPITGRSDSWKDQSTWFAGAPQTLTADYIHEGASGASGQVDEPYLAFAPGRIMSARLLLGPHTLAESFYMGIPGLSWMNVVIGDPLMRLHAAARYN